MKKVMFEFDGAINQGLNNWRGGNEVPGEPITGICDVLKSISESGYEITIYLGMRGCFGGISAVKKWLRKYNLDTWVRHISTDMPDTGFYIFGESARRGDYPNYLLSQIQLSGSDIRSKYRPCCKYCNRLPVESPTYFTIESNVIEYDKNDVYAPKLPISGSPLVVKFCPNCGRELTDKEKQRNREKGKAITYCNE